jgi:hypothetical protein
MHWLSQGHWIWMVFWWIVAIYFIVAGEMFVADAFQGRRKARDFARIDLEAPVRRRRDRYGRIRATSSRIA